MIVVSFELDSISYLTQACLRSLQNTLRKGKQSWTMNLLIKSQGASITGFNIVVSLTTFLTKYCVALTALKQTKPLANEVERSECAQPS